MQSRKWSLNKEDVQAWAKNGLMFVAPTLVVFFGQLQMGVSWKLAAPVAALAFYQSCTDLFRKYSSGR